MCVPTRRYPTLKIQIKVLFLYLRLLGVPSGTLCHYRRYEGATTSIVLSKYIFGGPDNLNVRVELRTFFQMAKVIRTCKVIKTREGIK